MFSEDGGDIAVGEFGPAECGQDYCPRGMGGGGGADIFIHTQARVIFLVSNF